MYIPGADKLLARIFGGVKPHMRLDATELELAKEIVQPVARSANRIALAIWITLTVIIVALALLRLYAQGRSINPIVDDRLFITSIGTALFSLSAGCFAALVLRSLIIRHQLGEQRWLFDRLYATQENWRPHRAMLFWSAIITPILLLSLLCTFLLGDRIDDRGILAPNGNHGLIARFHPHSDVSSITLYDQITAPIGIRTVDNLVVRFSDATTFYYMPDKDLRPPHPAKVAQFISDRSGIPITRERIRP